MSASCAVNVSSNVLFDVLGSLSHTLTRWSIDPVRILVPLKLECTTVTRSLWPVSKGSLQPDISTPRRHRHTHSPVKQATINARCEPAIWGGKEPGGRGGGEGDGEGGQCSAIADWRNCGELVAWPD